jgi:CelD/BcsL family acetyltransferase involved in cellulose biosynthesis
MWAREGFPVRISVVQPSELGPAEIATWRSFQYHTAPLANAFLSPDFAIAVGRQRPCARVAVLHDGADIAGFFPFERRGLGWGMPIGAGLTDFQGLVHAPGAEWDTRELLKACGISVWQFDHLVPGQKPFETGQTALADSPVIDLSQGYDAYFQALKQSSNKFCTDIRRKTRKMEREVGELRFVPDSQDVTDLRTLMAWKSAQYQRTGRIDRFSQPWVVDLVEDLLTHRSEHFGGELSMLYAGDVPVASHFAVRFGARLTFWFTAYSTQFNVYSPGLLHTLRTIESAAAQGVELIDLGKGRKRWKESLKSYDTQVAEGIVARPCALAALHWMRRTPTAWAIRQVRANETLFNAFDRALKKGGAVRGSLLARLGRPEASVQPALAAEPAADRQPSDGMMTRPLCRPFSPEPTVGPAPGQPAPRPSRTNHVTQPPRLRRVPQRADI